MYLLVQFRSKVGPPFHQHTTLLRQSLSVSLCVSLSLSVSLSVSLSLSHSLTVQSIQPGQRLDHHFIRPDLPVRHDGLPLWHTTLLCQSLSLQQRHHLQPRFEPSLWRKHGCFGYIRQLFRLTWVTVYCHWLEGRWRGEFKCTNAV